MILKGWFVQLLIKARMQWGSPSVATPKMEIQWGGGREEGAQEEKGLAPHGSGWPSGARPTQPQPDGPGSGGRLWGGVGCEESRRRREEEDSVFDFSASLRLCVFAIEFWPRMRRGGGVLSESATGDRTEPYTGPHSEGKGSRPSPWPSPGVPGEGATRPRHPVVVIPVCAG